MSAVRDAEGERHWRGDGREGIAEWADGARVVGGGSRKKAKGRVKTSIEWIVECVHVRNRRSRVMRQDSRGERSRVLRWVMKDRRRLRACIRVICVRLRQDRSDDVVEGEMGRKSRVYSVLDEQGRRMRKRDTIDTNDGDDLPDKESK